MADQTASLEVIITSEMAQVRADVSDLAGKIEKLDTSQVKGAAAASHHANEINQFAKSAEHGAKQVENLAKHIEFLGTGFRQARGIFLGGAFTFGFEQLIAGAAKFDLEAEKMARIMNGNAEAGSAWVAMAKIAGVEAQRMEMSFGHLSNIIQMNNGALGRLGIASQTATGQLLPLSEVINNTADWFQKNAGASNEAGVAMELFGRSGQSLLPILEQGRAGIAKNTEELKKLGFVMDQETLQRNAAFARSLEEAKLAAEGLFLKLGNALLPGIAALGQAIANNIPLMDAWIAAINRAISYVIGFIEGMTGQTLAVSDAANGLAALTANQGSYGDATDLAQHATKRNTDAIDDQIQTLKDQKSAMEGVLDVQVAQLKAQAQQEAFTDKVKSLQQRKADDEKRIANDSVKYQQDLLSGNLSNLQSVLDDAQKAKEDEAKVDLEISKATTDNKRNLEIKALEEQKKERAKDFDQQIKELERMKQEMTKAAQDGAAGIGQAFGTLPAMAGSAGGKMGEAIKFAVDSSTEGMGKRMGEKFEASLKSHDFSAVARTIGEAIGQGIAAGIGQEADKKLNTYWKGVGDRWDNLKNNIINGRGLNFTANADPNSDLLFGSFNRAAGGYVQPGRTSIVGEHGPELITGGPQGTTVTPTGGMGGTIIVQIDGAEVARAMSNSTQARSRGVRMSFA